MGNQCVAYLSIISFMLCVIAFSSLYSWNHLNSYYIKYLNRVQPKSIVFTYESGFYLYLFSIFISELSKILGVYLNNQLGIKITISLSFISIIFGQLFLYYFPQTITIYLGITLFGLGNGISLYPIMRNCWKMFFKSKGKVSGLIYFSRISSEILFSFFSERIVNPNHYEIDTVNMTYNIDLISNLRVYTVLCLLIYSFLGVITHFSIFEDKESNQSVTIFAERTTSINDVDNYLNDTKETEKKTKMQLIAEELFSMKYLKMIIMHWCLIYSSYIILNGFISFGTLNSLDNGALKKFSFFCSLCGAAISVLWGIVFDFKGYRKKFQWVILFQVISSLGIFCFVKFSYVFYFFVACAYISFIGANVLFPPFYYVQYNSELSLEIISLSHFLSNSALYIIPMLMKKMANSNIGFFCFFFISFAFIITAFVINDYFMYPKATNRLKEEVFERKGLRVLRKD